MVVPEDGVDVRELETAAVDDKRAVELVVDTPREDSVDPAELETGPVDESWPTDEEDDRVVVAAGIVEDIADDIGVWEELDCTEAADDERLGHI